MLFQRSISVVFKYYVFFLIDAYNFSKYVVFVTSDDEIASSSNMKKIVVDFSMQVKWPLSMSVRLKCVVVTSETMMHPQPFSILYGVTLKRLQVIRKKIVLFLSLIPSLSIFCFITLFSFKSVITRASRIASGPYSWRIIQGYVLIYFARNAVICQIP